LVGPNGSGKTTLLEILAGLRSPSSARVHVDCPRERVAYCPDVSAFEPWLTAVEALQSALGSLGQERTRSEVVDVLARVGQRARVVSLSPVRPSLKDVFLSLTSKPEPQPSAVDQSVAS
jgi:ABC-type multidrug transport system ATPase subunit